MKKYVSLLFIFVLQGCLVSVPSTTETRISTDLYLSQHNSISGRYQETKAFASVTEFQSGDGKEFLYYTADKYGTGKLWIAVPKSEVSTVVAGLNKYLEWSEKAKKNKDIFQKEITRFSAPSESSLINNFYKLDFFSGNSVSHFVLFSTCTSAGCSTTATVNEVNAKILVNELVKYESGSFNMENVASKYN